MTRVLIFGDSIAAGYYAPNNLGWVSLLNKEFMMKDLFFYNRAVSGHTSVDVKKYFEVELNAIDPSIVIVALGINDSQFEGKNKSSRISLDEFEENLFHFINLLKLKGKKVIFVSLTNVDESRTTPVSWREVYYYNQAIEKYDKKVKEIAEKEGLQVIDIFGLLENEDLEDGLHPNDKGHKKIYQIVKEFLIKNKVIKWKSI